jgi:hypothetical protein
LKINYVNLHDPQIELRMHDFVLSNGYRSIPENTIRYMVLRTSHTSVDLKSELHTKIQTEFSRHPNCALPERSSGCSSPVHPPGM